MIELLKNLPLFVSGGKVACKARSGDVPVQTCAACGALDRIVVLGEQQRVYCDRRDDRMLAILAYPR